jgi:nucleoside-diphosphate-sugar epimerase
VTDAASLRAAMTGCQQLVHLAAVVDIREPPDAASRQRMVDTALNGTRMVLGALRRGPAPWQCGAGLTRLTWRVGRPHAHAVAACSP